jgi:hypothetical protein
VTAATAIEIDVALDADHIITSCYFLKVIKANERAGSMPTRLAFPEPIAESFQIVFLTILESLILRLLHCVIVLSFLQHLHCCMLFVS